MVRLAIGVALGLFLYYNFAAIAAVVIGVICILLLLGAATLLLYLVYRAIRFVLVNAFP